MYANRKNPKVYHTTKKYNSALKTIVRQKIKINNEKNRT